VVERLRALAATTDPSMLLEIYQTFENGAADYLAAIRLSIQSSDAPGLRTAAHALKGASANTGANALAELASQLEAMGDSHSLAGAEDLLTRSEQEFARVKAEIKNV
jgi:HPt (histidine-containing phosphotransfer) domain-containing protein